MRVLSFYRLFLDAATLIFHLVRKEKTRERQTAMSSYKYPSAEELYALERWAHRERARAQARLILAGAKAVTGLVASAARKIIASRGPTARQISRQVVHHA